MHTDVSHFPEYYLLKETKKKESKQEICPHLAILIQLEQRGLTDGINSMPSFIPRGRVRTTDLIFKGRFTHIVLTAKH